MEVSKGLLVTTAQRVGAEVELRRAEIEKSEGMSIQIVTRDALLDLLLRWLGVGERGPAAGE